MDHERLARAVCVLVRQQLPDLVGQRLDTARAGEVRRHLLDCESCADALADLVLAEVANRPDALASPPFVPPIGLYEAFLRARKTRFGTLWKLVCDGLNGADHAAREWAETRRDAIGQAFVDLLSSDSSSSGGDRGEVRVRGAVRPRGAVRTRGGRSESTPASLVAEIVTSDSLPAGGRVRFQILERPRITGDGRFRVRLRTDARDCAGQIAFCTIGLGGADPVSFTAILSRRPDGDGYEAEIEEAGVATVPGEIPLDRVSLFVTRA